MKLTDITVTRTIPASAEKVYDVWINPNSIGGPRGKKKSDPVFAKVFQRSQLGSRLTRDRCMGS